VLRVPEIPRAESRAAPVALTSIKLSRTGIAGGPGTAAPTGYISGAAAMFDSKSGSQIPNSRLQTQDSRLPTTSRFSGVGCASRSRLQTPARLATPPLHRIVLL